VGGLCRSGGHGRRPFSHGQSLNAGLPRRVPCLRWPP
jgi:hypothetical protein